MCGKSQGIAVSERLEPAPSGTNILCCDVFVLFFFFMSIKNFQKNKEVKPETPTKKFFFFVSPKFI